MAYKALSKISDLPTAHYVSNVDSADLLSVLQVCDPASTLFIVSSKTFTTTETLTNAAIAKSWIAATLGDDAVAEHFLAVSTNNQGARAFGIPDENVFGFWDWVGGRFSISSAIGLSLAITLGRLPLKRRCGSSLSSPKASDAD